MRTIVLVLFTLAGVGCDSFEPRSDSDVRPDPAPPALQPGPTPTTTSTPGPVGFPTPTSSVESPEPDPGVAFRLVRAAHGSDRDGGMSDASASDSSARDGGRTCVFEFPEPPEGEVFDFDLDRASLETTIEAGQVRIARIGSEEDCAAFPGWYLDDPASPTEIVLCPEACTEVAGDLWLIFNTGFYEGPQFR